MQVVFAERTPAPDSPIKQNVYAYCYIYDEDQRYYRIMVKSPEYDDEFIDTVYRMLYSFSLDVKLQGTSKDYTDYHPIPNPDWNEETKKFYDELTNSKELKWGVMFLRV